MARRTQRQRSPVRMPPWNRIGAFQRRLYQWYEVDGRHFPWRNRSASHYQRVISEILLQRTRAETVAAFFTTFATRYPSWRMLARATRSELEEALKPVGLHRRRAAAVTALSKEMARRHGRFPEKREDIEALPGVGQYIANAVELFVHGRSKPLLDVNMARVLERYFGPRTLADIRHDPYLQKLASRVVECPAAADINWAVLDLAATTCRIRNPLCPACPLRSGCRTGTQSHAALDGSPSRSKGAAIR